MDWAKKHVDTVILLGALASGFLWLNGKFNDLDRRLVVIETVMKMTGISKDVIAKTEKLYD